MASPFVELLSSLPEARLRKALFSVHPELREMPFSTRDLIEWAEECGDETTIRRKLAATEETRPAGKAGESLVPGAPVLPLLAPTVQAALEKRFLSFSEELRERGEAEAERIEDLAWQKASRSWTGRSGSPERFSLMATERGRAGCTCPRFQKNGECRHVAAFLARLLRHGRPEVALPRKAPDPPKEDVVALSRLRRLGHEEANPANPLAPAADTARALRLLQEVARDLRPPLEVPAESRMQVVYLLEERGEGRRRTAQVVPRTEVFHGEARPSLEAGDLCATLARRTSLPKYVTPLDDRLIRACDRIRADDHRSGYGTDHVRHGDWHELFEGVASTGRLRLPDGRKLHLEPPGWGLVPVLPSGAAQVALEFRLSPPPGSTASPEPLSGDWSVVGAPRTRVVRLDDRLFPLDPRLPEPLLKLVEGRLVFDATVLRQQSAELSSLVRCGADVDASFLPPRFREAPLPRVLVDLEPSGRLRVRAQPCYPACGPLDPALEAEVAAFTLPDGRLAEQERDLPGEAEWRERLLRRLADLDLAGEPEHGARVLAGEEAVRRFAQDGIPALEADGWTVSGSDSLRRWRVREGILRLRGQASGVDWFQLSGIADFGGVEVPLSQLVAAGVPDEIHLPDGSVGRLPQLLLRRLRWIARLGAPAAGGLNLSRWHAGLADDLVESGLVDLEEPDLWRDLLAAASPTESEIPPPPSTLRATLRPYQAEGSDWLWSLRARGTGAILADDMGLGKTVQVIAHLCRIFEREGTDLPALVVAPASVAGNWVSELARFAPHIEVRFLHGLRRESLRDAALAGPTVFVTTYGILPREDAWLEEREFCTAVLDESQAIRNPVTAAHQACLRLRSRQKLCLTGTPVENSLVDLWAQFAFLNPGLLGPRDVFLTQFGQTPGEAPDLGRLRRVTSPFWLRRTKMLVAPELPERSDVELRIELEAPQRQLYQRQLAEIQAGLLAEVERDGLDEKNRFQVLAALLRLRQIACAPELAGHKGPSAKLDQLLDKLTEDVAEGHKALVFSSFTSLLDLAEARLREAGIPFLRLDGSTPARERTRLVERFQAEGGAEPVFLISLKAGGAGLNLTAADYVFLLDPWWNPAAEEQAAARSHRIGQTNPVVVYRMIARDTVEERILQLARTKKELARELFDSGESGGSALTLEVVRDLLG